MPRNYITPAHPWFHPDFPIEHRTFMGTSHHVTVHAGHDVNAWAAPSIELRVERNDHDGKQQMRMTNMGGQPEGMEQIERYHRAQAHVLKIAKDIASPKHALTRGTAERRDAPPDLHNQLLKHPDFLTRVAAHRQLYMKSMGDDKHHLDFFKAHGVEA